MIEQWLIDGEFEKVDQWLEEKEQQGRFDELYEASESLIQYGFFERAASIFQAMRAHFPHEAQLFVDEASMRFELGEDDVALELLEHVSEADEEYVQALLTLADYYEANGMLELALGKMEKAYELLPHEPIVQYGYAELLRQAGKHREAIRLYEQLLQLKESDFDEATLLGSMAMTLSEGAAYEEALPYFERLLDVEELPATQFAFAHALFQTEQYERAIALLQRAIELDPDYYAAYTLLGQTYAQLEKNKEAYEVFERGLTRDRFEKGLYLAAGKMAIKLGKREEAIKHFEEALALDPEHLEARLNLASLYEYEERHEAIVELLATFENNTPLMDFYLANAYEALEQYEKAGTLYASIQEDLNTNVDYLNRYASFLVEEGRRDEALPLAQKLLTLTEDPMWSDFVERMAYEDDFDRYE